MAAGNLGPAGGVFYWNPQIPGPLRRHRLRPAPNTKMKSALFLLALLVLSLPLCAQTAALRGQVMDETGAVVPGATVMLNGPSGLAKTATSGSDGSYSFIGLPPGSYTVRVSAPDLTQAQPAKISLQTGAQSLNLKMNVASVTQHTLGCRENAFL